MESAFDGGEEERKQIVVLYSPSILADVGDFPQFGVVAFECRSGVFDVVDVVHGVAVVADLPDGEGFGFLCGEMRGQEGGILVIISWESWVACFVRT
jgi:hypothetical protein